MGKSYMVLAKSIRLILTNGVVSSNEYIML